MPVHAVGIDWGGKSGTSVRALEFWRSLKARKLHARVRLIKGDARREGGLFRETFRQQQAPGPQIRVEGRCAAAAAQRGPTEGHGGRQHQAGRARAGLLPLSRLAARGVLRGADGRIEDGPRLGKLAKRRNEAFDLCGYAEGMALWLKVPAINWTAPPAWAAPWDDNPDVRADDVAPAPTPRTRTRRVIRSKYLGR